MLRMPIAPGVYFHTLSNIVSLNRGCTVSSSQKQFWLIVVVFETSDLYSADGIHCSLRD